MTERALIGELVDGRYRVDALVGEGGFGTVYRAFHVGLGARVALKVPRVDELAPGAVPEAVATFLEEGRTLKKLRHPAVVAALDVGLLPPDETGLALPYLVLEWCEGPTLREWLAKQRAPLPPREAWALLRPVVDAIAHAHAEGVAHRDIKPANILLETTRDGRLAARVIDFGIAKVLGAGDNPGSGGTLTTAQTRAYTPRYAAPEQLAGLRTGPATDVYALALVLIELLIGFPVFGSDDEARRSVAELDLPTPQRLGVAPGAWSDVLARALSARVAERFPDAGALLRALDGAAGSAPVDPRPSGPIVIRELPQAAPLRSPGERSAVADDSVVPSSRTTRTGTSAEPASRTRLWAAGIAAVVLGAAAAATWVGAAARENVADAPVPDTQEDATSHAPGSSVPGSSAAGSTTATPPRELSTLTGAEIAERAAAGGMTGCHAVNLGAVVQVVCDSGNALLRDWRTGGSGSAADDRRNIQHQARMHGAIYGAARFTMDGGWGLIVASRSAVIDAAMEKILAGIQHEPVGTEVMPPPTHPVPPRLAQWNGPEVAERIIAAGGEVTFEVSTATPTVNFLLGTEPGSTQLFEGSPEMWLAAMKSNPTPRAYAIDGNRLLVCSGKGKAGTLPFLKSLLGTTAATRFGQVP